MISRKTLLFKYFEGFVYHIEVAAKIAMRLRIDRVFPQVIGDPTMKVAFLIACGAEGVTVGVISFFFIGLVSKTHTMQNIIIY